MRRSRGNKCLAHELQGKVEGEEPSPCPASSLPQRFPQTCACTPILPSPLQSYKWNIWTFLPVWEAPPLGRGGEAYAAVPALARELGAC